MHAFTYFGWSLPFTLPLSYFPLRFDGLLNLETEKWSTNEHLGIHIFFHILPNTYHLLICCWVSQILWFSRHYSCDIFGNLTESKKSDYKTVAGDRYLFLNLQAFWVLLCVSKQSNNFHSSFECTIKIYKIMYQFVYMFHIVPTIRNDKRMGN